MSMQKDKQIQADKSLFCALFPEQTKTPTRIVVWSLILLADLILLAAGAMHFGILSLENFSRGAVLLLILTVAVFWLQGVIWGAVAKLFRKEK